MLVTTLESLLLFSLNSQPPTSFNEYQQNTTSFKGARPNKRPETQQVSSKRFRGDPQLHGARGASRQRRPRDSASATAWCRLAAWLAVCLAGCLAAWLVLPGACGCCRLGGANWCRLASANWLACSSTSSNFAASTLAASVVSQCGGLQLGGVQGVVLWPCESCFQLRWAA